MNPLHQLIRYAFFLALGTYLAYPFLSDDVFMGIALGKWMVANHSVPTSDVWQLSNQPLFASTWLFDLILAQVFAWQGEMGVAVLHILLSVGIVVLLGAAFQLATREGFLSALLAGVVGASLLTAEVSPQELCSWSVFVGLVMIALSSISNVGLFAVLVVGANLSLFGTLASILSLLIARKGGIIRPLPLLSLPLFLTPHTFTLLNYTEISRLGFFIPLLVEDMAGPKILSWLVKPVFEFRFALLLILFAFGGAVCLTRLSEIREHLEQKVSERESRREPSPFMKDMERLFEEGWNSRGSVQEWSPVTTLSVLAQLFFGSLFLRFLAPYFIIAVGGLIAILWRGVPKSHNLAVGVELLKERLGRLPAAGVVWIFLCVMTVNMQRIVKNPTAFLRAPTKAVDFVVRDGRRGGVIYDSEIAGYMRFRLSSGAGEVTRLGYGVKHLESYCCDSQQRLETPGDQFQQTIGRSSQSIDAAIKPPPLLPPKEANAAREREITSAVCRENTPLCDGAREAGWSETYRSGEWRVFQDGPSFREKEIPETDNTKNG